MNGHGDDPKAPRGSIAVSSTCPGRRTRTQTEKRKESADQNEHHRRMRALWK